jgi:hypothetical protein
VPAAAPILAVTLSSAASGEVLRFPPAPGQPARTVVVDLDAEEIDVHLHPVPMTLEVHLVEPSTGQPRQGRTVVARATRGPATRPTTPLPEGDLGVYTSAAVEWTAAFTPCELLVNGTLLRVLSMDFTSTTTIAHLVDTT